MKLLAISTSQPETAVAWSDGSETILVPLPAKGIGEALRPTIAPLVERGFDRIIVDTGPGSYTGTRVGVAYAQGLSVGSGKPWVGFTSFQLLDALKPAEATSVVAVRSSEVLAWVGGEVKIMPLAEVTHPYGFPTRDAVRYGGDASIFATFPTIEAWMKILVQLGSQPDAAPRFPEYYDRYSTPPQ